MRKKKLLEIHKEDTKEIEELQKYIKDLPNTWGPEGIIVCVSYNGCITRRVRYFDGTSIRYSKFYECGQIDVIHATIDTIILKLIWGSDERYIGINRYTHEEYSLPKSLFEEKEKEKNIKWHTQKD